MFLKHCATETVIKREGKNNLFSGFFVLLLLARLLLPPNINKSLLNILALRKDSPASLANTYVFVRGDKRPAYCKHLRNYFLLYIFAIYWQKNSSMDQNNLHVFPRSPSSISPLLNIHVIWRYSCYKAWNNNTNNTIPQDLVINNCKQRTL